MITLLVGNIASGKSTHVQKHATKNTLIVSDDLIVEACHGGMHLLYDEKLKPLYKMIEQNIICFAISHDYDVIVDRPCLTKQTRSRYVSLAKALDTKINAIIFPFHKPEIHARRRYESNNRSKTYDEWLYIATCNYERYEFPTLDEGFVEVSYG